MWKAGPDFETLESWILTPCFPLPIYFVFYPRDRETNNFPLPFLKLALAENGKIVRE